MIWIGMFCGAHFFLTIYFWTQMKKFEAHYNITIDKLNKFFKEHR